MITVEYSVYFVVAFIILVYRMDNIAAAWQNGKAKVEEQKTLGKQADTRTSENNVRAEELKLERAKLEHNVPVS